MNVSKEEVLKGLFEKSNFQVIDGQFYKLKRYTQADFEIAGKKFLSVCALHTKSVNESQWHSYFAGDCLIEKSNIEKSGIKKILSQEKKIKELAKKYKDYNNFLYIGRKYNFPVAFEGALKLKEISYIHSESYPGGELKHGPLALIDENFPTIAICPSDSVYEKMVSNIQEIKARGGKVLAVATQGNEDIKDIADDVIYIPKTSEMLTPILSVVPLQLFAYHMGVLKGCDVDKPRNLAKSVTVE